MRNWALHSKLRDRRRNLILNSKGQLDTRPAPRSTSYQPNGRSGLLSGRVAMEFQRLSISADLSTIFAPSSVAIFGASDDRTKLGHAAVKLLKEGGFAGEITPINPKGGSVLGLPMRK